MGELKYRAETSANGLGEAVKIISSQTQRMESALREFRSMAEQAEKIEEENTRLKKEIEEMEKRHAKEVADLARQQK